MELLAYVPTIFCADDTCGDRRIQPEWAANCQYPITNLHAIRVAQLGDRQFSARLDFDDSEIGFLVHAHDFGGVLLCFAVQLDLDLGRLVYNVVVGENKSFFIHDDSGSQTALGCRWSVLPAIKKPIKEILHGIVGIIR